MAFDNTMVDYYRTLYKTSWNAAIQQETSMLKDTVTMSQSNEQRWREQFWEAAHKLDAKTGRLQPTVRHEGAGKFRWGSTSDFQYANIIDEFDEDKLADNLSPRSLMIKNQAIAYQQNIDDVIIAAATASVDEGKTGGTSVAWDTTHDVAQNYVRTGSAANSGLTWAKICRVNKMFKDNYIPVNGGNVNAVIGTLDEEDLIADVAELKNSDYSAFKSIPVIPDGNLNGKVWMGFKWIVCPKIAPVSNVTTNLFYTREALTFNEGVTHNYVNDLPETSNAIQFRLACYCGALRLRDEAIFTVKTYHA